MSRRLGELAELVGGTVFGDPELVIESVGTLDRAGARELSFLTNPKYLEAARTSAAGALLVGPDVTGLETNLLVAENPYLALGAVLAVLAPTDRPEPGIHPTAIVDSTAQLGEDVSVGAYCCIGAGTAVARGVTLHPHVVIGADCVIGEGTVIYPQVSIYPRTVLGSAVIVHSGVVLGADGFGYAQEGGKHVKIPQIGQVVVEDDVEIGSNSTVDRAMLHETRVGAGTKIDNLVMVAHNVEVGKGCLLISQVGVAGSSKLGDGVVLAGQTGVAGHMDVGDGVQVASKSAVFKDAEPGARLAGIPAVDSMVWRRQQVRLRRLGDLEKRLAALEKRLGEEGEDGKR